MRVAIVHDWLTVTGGAERVLAEILALYPQADLYTVVDFLPAQDREWLGGRKVTTSFIQSLPFARKLYRHYLPLMPLAVEQWDFSCYDLVVSSSYAVVKGLITGPNTTHVSYVHSPMRYAWDLQASYLQQVRFGALKDFLARYLLHRIRLWDQVSAQRVDGFVANSAFIAGRIRKLYRRSAQVVHPPVAIERFCFERPAADFFLTTSRLVPYKRIDLIVEAFAGMPEYRLVVIGDGPEMAAVRAKAGPNVEIRGRQSDAEVTEAMETCRAFVFAALEDFGITPLEAQACGRAVIAYQAGGVLETLRFEGPGQSAVGYGAQTVEALQAAVRRFAALEPGQISAQSCRNNAERFSSAAFREQLARTIAMVQDEGQIL